MAADHAPDPVPTMKPFLSSAFSLALLFSTLGAGPARAAEGGEKKTGQNSPASDADEKALSAAEALYAEAEKESRSLIAAETRALGPEAGATLKSRRTLAALLTQQHKEAEAEKECRQVLALSERTLGAEHPETLSTCYHLAVYLGTQKKTQEALKYAQRAYAGRVKVLGRDHEDTREANELVERLTKPETKA